MGLKLNRVPVGDTVEIGEVSLRISLTSNGCKGCAFQSDLGAVCCPYRAFCFADQRPDKRSVKFIEVDK